MRHIAPRVVAPILVTAALGSILWVSAGSLTPPGGPVGPTMKPLNEVEPRVAINAINTPGDADSVYRITQAGSYYLTGNVTGEAGKSGIEIAASHVTVDLMGYALQGVAGSLSGVQTDEAFDNLTIRNGTVTGWTASGVDLTVGGVASVSFGSLIESVSASSNGSYGLRAGQSAVIRDCIATFNTNIGISALSNAVIESCVARKNGSHGFSPGSISTIHACASFDNDGIGFSALNTTISHCAANTNGSDGIVSAGGTVSNCTALENGANGIRCGANGATVTNCTVSFNTQDGIFAIGDATISHCTATQNTDDGIAADTKCIITDCITTANGNDGIEIRSNCLVRDNACSNNGVGGTAAGIHVIATGTVNRIEANTLLGNDRGVDVDAAGNLIIRNSASGNTLVNYDIVANNRVGVIVNAPNSLAINGSTGGAGVGTTDPWSNLSY